MPVHVVKRKGRLKSTTTARNPLRELSGCKKKPARRRVRAYYRHKSSIVSSDPLFSLRFTLGGRFRPGICRQASHLVVTIALAKGTHRSRTDPPLVSARKVWPNSSHKQAVFP